MNGLSSVARGSNEAQGIIGGASCREFEQQGVSDGISSVVNTTVNHNRNNSSVVSSSLMV